MSRYERSPRSRSSQSRMRMDCYNSSNGRTASRGKSSPKRSELNNVMRKARQDSSKPSMYWNKKLLEAEEKDPNRWRHSGYKELYAGGDLSPSGAERANARRSRSRSARSRSKSHSRSKSRSYSPRQHRRMLPSSARDRIRSPPLPARVSPPLRQRSRDRDRERERERDRDRDRDRDRERERERERERDRERDRERVRELPREKRRSRPRRPQTPEPPPPKPAQRRGDSRIDNRSDGRSKRRTSPQRAPSASGSSRSVSSCSDSVCSVCLPKSKGKKVPSPPTQNRRHSPPLRRAATPPRRLPVPSPPMRRAAPSPPPRRPPVNLSPPPSDPRGPPPSPPPAARRAAKAKRRAEREKAKLKASSKKRRAAAGFAVVKLENAPRPSPPPDSDSDSGSVSSRSSLGAPRLTLSERFGKMAQWSENRRDLDGVRNMRITKDSEGTDFKVVIEEEEEGPFRPLSPMPVSDRRVGLGFFPEALHSAPVGLEAWDDVRVRYQYYKDRGYLRDLTLDDYMKWEEWWYKYQEWLEAERYYEQWHAMRGHLRGRGRKRNRI